MNNIDKKIDSPVGETKPNGAQELQPVEKSFDERIHDIVGSFFKSENVENAIVIARDPNTGDLAVMYCGHFYDVAKILNEVNRNFKSKIGSELGD